MMYCRYSCILTYYPQQNTKVKSMLTTLCVLTMNNSLTYSSNYSALNSCSVSLSVHFLCAVRTNVCRCYTALSLFSDSSHSPMPVWKGGDDTHTHIYTALTRVNWNTACILSFCPNSKVQRSKKPLPLVLFVKHQLPRQTPV